MKTKKQKASGMLHGSSTPRAIKVVSVPKKKLLVDIADQLRAMKLALPWHTASLNRLEDIMSSFVSKITPDAALDAVLRNSAYAVRGSGSIVGDAVATIHAMETRLLSQRDEDIQKRRGVNIFRRQTVINDEIRALRAELAAAQKDLATYRGMVNSGSA